MRPIFIAVTAFSFCLSLPAEAATCGNTSAGFETWKKEFATEAKGAGVKSKGLSALAGTRYATRTIAADRNQKSFRYTLDKFMQLRGSPTIVAQGRKRLARDPDFYHTIEKKYGVPQGVLLAIHGMETAFGSFMGDSNVVSSIATLAYDCRRTEFFTEHTMAALKLVDRGVITADAIGAKHGELGHTQFLPGNVLKYAVDGDGDGRINMNGQADALASTANFLKKKGWKKGQGYLQGQPNFDVIKQWNAATVYQQAIAIMASQIDS